MARIWVISLLILLSTQNELAESSNILVLYPLTTKSHLNFVLPLMEALLDRGHHVTYVSPYQPPFQSSNLSFHLSLATMDTVMSSTMSMNMTLEKMRTSSKLLQPPILMLASMIQTAIKHIYSSPDISKLMDSQQTFDVIIVNGLMSESCLGMVDKFKAPVIHMTANVPFHHEKDLMGNPVELSYVPNLFLDFDSKMSFLERLENTVFDFVCTLLYQYRLLPIVDKELRKVQELSDDLWSIRSKYTSLIITNSHFAVNNLRPYVPAIVPLGGLHCRDVRPLPKDLAEFVEGSGEHGFIFFSMGTIVTPHMMPESHQKVFVQAFSQLKQRILWKWSNEALDLPSNVKVSKWLPQQDILGHSKCRLFISHGGLLSTQEATWHGVPVLGFPMFGDQDMNMRRVERDGQGIRMEMMDITTETLLAATRRLLTEKSFKKTAIELSKIFRDREVHPLEAGVFWVEHIIRHKGGRHLRSAAADMNWIQYYLVDVYLFISAVLAGFIWGFFAVIRFVCARRGKDSRQKRKKE